MPKTLLTIAMIGLTALLAFAAPASAGAEEPRQANRDDTVELPAVDPTTEVTVAAEAVVWGRRNNDPLALIAAASLLSRIDIATIEREKSSLGGSESDKAATSVLDLETILAEARDMAADDRRLQAMIDDVASAGTRGRVRGPAQHVDRIEAGATDRFEEIEFRGNELAAVGVVGDGDTDLDLIITDEFGIEVCRAATYADREVCRWAPRWTGPFTITVINNGQLWNQYRLFTN